jgi:hypothetical protein
LTFANETLMEPETSNPTSNAKPWIYSAVFFGLPMGVLYSLQNNNWVIGMGGGLVAGALFATLIRWFAARQTKRFSVDRPDLDGAAILFEGPANHFKGAEGVGGYLWLTSGQLFFRSHRFNIQNHDCRMPLSEITEVEATKTLGMIRNGLLVRLVSGTQERFVVNKNGDWAARILGARMSDKEPQTDQNSRGEVVRCNRR